MAKLPFNASNLDPKDKLIYDAMLAKRKNQGAPFGGPYAALMNHPELCQKIEELGYYLKFQGHLPREVYQFVVLAVAKRTKAAFEWDDHIKHALAAGVPESVIQLLKNQETPYQNFPAPYHLAAEILNETLSWKNIPDKLQANSIAGFYKGSLTNLFNPMTPGIKITELSGNPFFFEPNLSHNSARRPAFQQLV